MDMQLSRMKEQIMSDLQSADTTGSIEELKIKFLGRKGEITQLLRSMGSVAAEERPILGQKINAMRQEAEDAIAERMGELKQKEKQDKLLAERLDVTIPGKKPSIGSVHPISMIQQQLVNIFIGMGFQVAEGPEVELDHFNFELLNVPKNHPARDMQDSFYISENLLLRTHTSPVQARTMLSQKPPIRIVCPGRVYRVDEVDATHSPVFHQIEGLVVDEDINMGHLKGAIDTFAKVLYGEDTKTRFRPSFFPFTEPSAEVDVSCYICHGNDPDCKVCKGTGWIEILGCGMVNPRVLEMCGIDSSVYSGFAFGLGLDRITVSKYGISDIRALFENDIRFLSQF